MTGLDLSGIEAILDQWLIDSLEVVRTNGSADGVLDPETGVIADPAAPVIWSGPGAVQSLDAASVDQDPDTAQTIASTGATHRALIPLRASVDAQFDDVLRVVAVRSPSASPRLVGTTYQVVKIGGQASFAAVQFLWLRDLATVPPLDTPPAGP